MFFYHEFPMSKENKALPWHWAKNNLLKHEQSHCKTDASAKHPGVSEVREKKECMYSLLLDCVSVAAT